MVKLGASKLPKGEVASVALRVFLNRMFSWQLQSSLACFDWPSLSSGLNTRMMFAY